MISEMRPIKCIGLRTAPDHNRWSTFSLTGLTVTSSATPLSWVESFSGDFMGEMFYGNVFMVS